MSVNTLVKNIMLAVALFALVACSSNEDSKDSGYVEENTINNNIDTGLSAQELSAQQLEQLKDANIIYFDFDKYDIRSDFAELLNAHAMFLRTNSSYNIIIEGHADERGTPEYNIALGERRASAVFMYLQGKGVSASQLSIVSYGKEKPAVQGHDDVAYAKNRRAVLVY